MQSHPSHQDAAATDAIAPPQLDQLQKANSKKLDQLAQVSSQLGFEIVDIHKISLRHFSR